MFEQQLQAILFDNKGNRLTEAALIGLHSQIIQAHNKAIEELKNAAGKKEIV